MSSTHAAEVQGKNQLKLAYFLGAAFFQCACVFQAKHI